VSSNEPDGRSGEVYGGEEVSGGFVVACGDASEEFEFGEEVLDQVARFVEFFIVFPLHFSVRFGRDDGLFSSLLQGFEHPLVGVKALVGDHRVGFQLRQQDICPVQLTGLAFGEMETQRIAERIDRGVDLGAQSAFAATDGL
jgi:hypothetical protein